MNFAATGADILLEQTEEGFLILEKLH